MAPKVKAETADKLIYREWSKLLSANVDVAGLPKNHRLRAKREKDQIEAVRDLSCLLHDKRVRQALQEITFEIDESKA